MLYQLSYIHHHVLGSPREQDSRLARLEGIEPPTDGLEIRCSILLSYRRTTTWRGAHPPVPSCGRILAPPDEHGDRLGDVLFPDDGVMSVYGSRFVAG